MAGGSVADPPRVSFAPGLVIDGYGTRFRFGSGFTF